MSYDTNNLKNNRGGATTEVSDVAPAPAGLWRHPQSGQEIITLYDPLFGDVQSEGIARLGFERVGDAPKGAVKSVVEAILDNKAKDSSTAGLAARVEALEGVKENLAAVESENDELRKKLALYEANDAQTVKSGEEAKDEAEAQVEARGTDNSGHVEANGGVNAAGTFGGTPVTQANQEAGATEEAAERLNAAQNAQDSADEDKSDEGSSDENKNDNEDEEK